MRSAGALQGAHSRHAGPRVQMTCMRGRARAGQGRWKARQCSPGERQRRPPSRPAGSSAWLRAASLLGVPHAWYMAAVQAGRVLGRPAAPPAALLHGQAMPLRVPCSASLPWSCSREWHQTTEWHRHPSPPFPDPRCPQPLCGGYSADCSGDSTARCETFGCLSRRSSSNRRNARHTWPPCPTLASSWLVDEGTAPLTCVVSQPFLCQSSPI